MKYLGIPIDEKRLCLGDWKSVLEKHENKLGCWQGRNLVVSGRATLINSSLASIFLYMLSFYRIPVGAKHKADMGESRFLWSGDKNKKKVPPCEMVNSLFS